MITRFMRNPFPEMLFCAGLTIVSVLLSCWPTTLAGPACSVGVAEMGYGQFGDSTLQITLQLRATPECDSVRLSVTRGRVIPQHYIPTDSGQAVRWVVHNGRGIIRLEANGQEIMRSHLPLGSLRGAP